MGARESVAMPMTTVSEFLRIVEANRLEISAWN
jgi:hypothetical protein